MGDLVEADDDFKAMLRAAFPSYGPDWEAAIEYGIDVSLLVENLELAPGRRLLKGQDLARFHDELRRARRVRKEVSVDVAHR